MFDRWFKKRAEPPYVPEEKPLPPQRGIEIMTDTATVVIFDIAALAHRLSDDCDWWADPGEEVRELNARNLLILGVGVDGFYDVDVIEEDGPSDRVFSLTFPSGRVFVGPGEEITGEGRQPTGEDGGFFVQVAPGSYRVGVSRDEDQVQVRLIAAEPFDNAVTEAVRL